jgi:hypothetical protein
MYKDIIIYTLADGVTEEHLLRVASEITKSWMSKQEGFISWEIHSNNNGNYTDIVIWRDKDAARAAEAKMMNVPNSSAWFACYDKSTIKSKNLTRIGEFK